MKILNEAKIYITLMAMVISFALYLWNEKIILMKKEQQFIVNDDAELEVVISDL